MTFEEGLNTINNYCLSKYSCDNCRLSDYCGELPLSKKAVESVIKITEELHEWLK